MKHLIALLLMIILLLPVTIWYGFVLVQLWGWFIEPMIGVTFTNIFHAAGVVLLVRMFSSSKPKRKEEEPWEQLVSSLGISILAPAFALGFGWLLYLLAF